MEAGKQGVIGLAVPSELGGGGERDFRYRCVVTEELAKVEATSLSVGIAVQDDIVDHYLINIADDVQQRRWLPGLASGERIGAIAMTEPGAGSDLQGIRTTAVRDGDDWVINGQKTFITNGIHADVIVVFARTDPDAGSKGFSLFVVERGDAGFERGRKLDKIGLDAQDTSELYLTDVRVGADRLLGEAGRGLPYLMQNLPLERLSLATGALASSEAALAWTMDYAYGRTAFGQRVGDFQNTRFVLAELETEVDVARAYLERCVLAYNRGELTTVQASKAKWWISELQQRVVSRGLQLFGGYGFMTEYPIARAFRDARVQTIYGGTTEIMKEIIGRDQASRYSS